MTILQNSPSVWRDKFPVHDPCGHKYNRGVAIIYGAPKMTGATRLAARACARIGAGLVKVVAPEGTGAIYRSTLHEEIIVEDSGDFKGLDDPRITAVLMGPGCTPEDVAPPPSAGHRPVFVFDAGAVAHWKKGASILTPHDGEFAKAFPHLAGDRLENAMAAARDSGAVIVLKGPRTIVADEQDAIVQDRPVPELATAGTGDVLAGMITGLVAQGMEIMPACAAAVLIHAEAAARFGKGMVAGDLPDMIPDVLQSVTIS